MGAIGLQLPYTFCVRACVCLRRTRWQPVWAGVRVCASQSVEIGVGVGVWEQASFPPKQSSEVLRVRPPDRGRHCRSLRSHCRPPRISPPGAAGGRGRAPPWRPGGPGWPPWPRCPAPARRAPRRASSRCRAATSRASQDPRTCWWSSSTRRCGCRVSDQRDIGV